LSNRNLAGDIGGGFAAAAVALPLALAFGVASGLGALAGIYGAIVVGFFASAFGGTSVQISGPTGPMTVVVATIVSHFSGNLGLVFTVIMLAGVLQIVFGKAGFGQYIKLVPQPVISGFMTGIGAIVIILQIGPMLGFDSPQGSNLVKLAASPAMVLHANFHAVFLGLFSFIVVSFTPKKISNYVPSTLLAVVFGTIIGILFFKQAPVIGEIPSGLPALYLPSVNLADLPEIIRFAMLLAFLGSIDSLLTSLAADSKTKTHHDSNRELIGQGIGNLSAGLIGAVPGAGATMRTFVNIASGGTTRRSGIIHAAFLLIMALVFAKEASHIPLAVLGGILLKVGIDIIDWRTLMRIRKLPRPGVFIMLTTLTLTVFVDLLTAVAAGTVMASVIFVSKMADFQMKNIKSSLGGNVAFDLTTEEENILDQVGDKVVLLQIEGPLSFATARDITLMMEETASNDVLLIDLSRVPFIDSSAASTLEQATERLVANDDHIIILGACDRVLRILQKTDVFEMVGEGQFVANRLDALKLAQKLVNQ